MDSKKFRTQTIIKPRENISPEDTWVSAIDIGYSAVKVFSPNMVACFPAFATKMAKGAHFISEAPDKAIMYRDNRTGDIWMVGEVAQNRISNNDTSNSEMALYGRKRYTHKMFKVITRCGLALSLMTNQYGSPEGKKRLISTGLPERYMNDERELRAVLETEHDFSIKLGNGDWIDYKLEYSHDDIKVMSQPKGTLFSICVDRSGHFIKEARNYLKSSGIIFDPGFGTLDIFFIEAGEVDPDNGETFEDLGMKRVLQETSAILRTRYGVDIPVPNMQKFLEKGEVSEYNRLEDQVKTYDINEALAEANRTVAYEAIERLKDRIDPTEYDYIVFTGGTSHAWITMLENAFNYPGLKIVYGNQNDDLGFTFSNVRGYYMNETMNVIRNSRGQK